MSDKFGPAERQWLQTMQSALATVQGDVSLPQLVALLTVAVEPGLSVNDLADRTGSPQQTASRYVSILLGRYETAAGSGPSQPLISQGVSNDDPRKRALFLTEAGAQLVSHLLPQAERAKRNVG